MWRTYLGRPVTDEVRHVSMGTLGLALRGSDNETALSVLEAELAVIRRFQPNTKIAAAKAKTAVLVNQANTALIYETLGRHDEALPLIRATYVGHREHSGPVHRDTVHSGTMLIRFLLARQCYAEAREVARELARAAVMEEPEDVRDFVTIACFVANAFCRGPAPSREDMVDGVKLLEFATRSARLSLGTRHPLTSWVIDELKRMREHLAKA